MPLPAELLQSIADEAGGRVVFVLGAGCSKEAPTGLELARELSERLHDDLLRDGVLEGGECEDPSDLSVLADTVYEKLGVHAPLVQRFPRAAMRVAVPNLGHLLVAALLIEGAVAHILTLNFDLAVTNALAALGAGNVVSVVAGPNDFAQVSTRNLIYLHRNVDAHPEDWILRTEQLETDWVDGWQHVLTTKVLTTPVTVFAGLGSPARVLTDTARRIRTAMLDETLLFVVDPYATEGSPFIAALEMDADSVIDMTWTDFMSELSSRVVAGQQTRLQSACNNLIDTEGLAGEDVAGLTTRFCEFGLLDLGHTRSEWLLDSRPYASEGTEDQRTWIADLLLAIGALERETDSEAIFFRDGVVELRRGRQIIGCVRIAHGRGHRGWLALESAVSVRLRSGGHNPPPTAVLVSGVSGEHRPAVSPPEDIVSTGSGNDLVTAASQTPPMVGADELRADPTTYVRILIPDD